MRFAELLARHDQVDDYPGQARKWIRRRRRGMCPPPPNSDLSTPPGTIDGDAKITGAVWVQYG
ncbi:MAG: hypothetical protein ACREEC_04270, partial [Thermoplasmata archaeon]